MIEWGQRAMDSPGKRMRILVAGVCLLLLAAEATGQAPQSYTDWLESGSVLLPGGVPGELPVANMPTGFTEYSVAANFDAAFPGLPIEGFEKAPVFAGRVIGCDEPTDIHSNDACFRPGDIMAGMANRTAEGRRAGCTGECPMVVLGARTMGNDDILNGPNYFADTLQLDITRTSCAVGMFVHINVQAGEVLQVDVTTGATSFTTTVAATPAGAFWGISSDAGDPIRRITITSPSSRGELIDNVRLADAASCGHYVLDRFGGLHAGGVASVPSPPTPYWGFDAAQDLELTPTGHYVLDRFGGVHAAGGASALNPATPYWGFDVAQDLELAPAGGGYVLDRYGGVHPGGGAVAILPATPYWGLDAAQDLEVLPSGAGYYVLDRYGGVHRGGAAPVMSPATPYMGFDIAQDLELADSGYYVLDRFGGVHAGGGAPVQSPATPYWGFDVAQDIELAGTGYYVLDRYGGVHAGGGATSLSSPTPYWGFNAAQDLELR